MIFDTDILSMLGKIGKTDLLRKLFPKTSLVISFEVYNELLRAKEAGYDFVDDILEQGFGIVCLDSFCCLRGKVWLCDQRWQGEEILRREWC